MGMIDAGIKKLLAPPTVHAKLFRDKVYSDGGWDAHRNANLRHRPEPWVCLNVALGFTLQLFYVMIVAVAVGMYSLFSPSHWPQLQGQTFGQAASMISFALSLLLVFRTNSSYGRWWEARTVWGQLVNYTRALPRQALLYLPPRDRALAVDICRWVMAAPEVLKAHIRAGEDVQQLVQPFLLPREIQALMAFKNKPLYIGQVLTRLVQSAHVDSYIKMHLDDQIVGFVNSAGACERIFKTAIPAAYTRHTSRFLMIYVSMGPFLMWPACGWLSVPLSMLVAFLLLGTENIGVQIEEPFKVLALDAMTKGIQDNVREMMLACEMWDGRAAAEPKVAAAAGPAGPGGRDDGSVPCSSNGQHQMAAALDLDSASQGMGPPSTADIRACMEQLLTQ